MKTILIIGHFTLDSISLFAQKSAHFDIPQGNVLSASIGAYMWGKNTIIPHARIGVDYPSEIIKYLHSKSFNMDHLIPTNSKSLKFWILRENDLNEQDLSFLENNWIEMSPTVESVLSVVNSIKVDAVHICPMPINLQIEISSILKSKEVFLSIDPPPINYTEKEKLVALSKITNILSVSYRDICLAYKHDSKKEICQKLSHRGAIVCLRDGSLGSIIFSKSLSLPVKLGAYKTPVEDETGAGDCYCGSFLAYYLLSNDIISSAIAASVSASFMIEKVGMIHAFPEKSEFQRRFKKLLKEISRNNTLEANL